MSDHQLPTGSGLATAAPALATGIATTALATPTPVQPTPVQITKHIVPVQLTRTDAEGSSDESLWIAIRNRTEALSFKRYSEFIDAVLCREESAQHGGTCVGENDERKIGAPSLGEIRRDLLNRPAIYGIDAYNLLSLATRIFLMVEAGVVKADGRKVTLLDPELFDAQKESARLGRPVTLLDVEADLLEYFGMGNPKAPSSQLPYLRRILDALPVKEEKSPYCKAVLQHRLSCPSLIELVWSYWHEEGMLVQTMKAIALRFQNRRGPAERDPLANLELDSLRPLNNLLWGYMQEDYRRLSVVRRAYEYDHQYGLNLVGKAVPALAAADSRSKFIEAFHNLMHRAAKFYREDADTTVIADGFELLNAIREVHMVLAEGAHNQFGDLPWTAREEMLIEQWLLARPEMREFLRGRHMVPYQEAWMGAVDDMKRLQGWTDVSVSHFHNLAVFGERILLSVRYGDWIAIDNHEQAKNWARYWRPEIQGYIHAYLAATGVDLAADLTDERRTTERYTVPSVLLQRRLAARQPQARLTAARVQAAELSAYAELATPPQRRLPRRPVDE